MSNQTVTDDRTSAPNYTQDGRGEITFVSPALDTQSDIQPWRCGYGACSKADCNCKGYEGSGSTCANPGCGHGYSDHW
jgi:hypothetical protein